MMNVSKITFLCHSRPKSVIHPMQEELRLEQSSSTGNSQLLKSATALLLCGLILTICFLGSPTELEMAVKMIMCMLAACLC